MNWNKRISKRNWRRKFGKAGWHVIEYIILRTFAFCIQILPKSVVYFITGRIGYVLGKYYPIRGYVIKRNLNHVYGTYNRDFIAKIIQQSTITFIESARAYHWGMQDFTILFDPQDYDMNQLRGQLLFTAHLGNWELLSGLMGTSGLEFYAVAKTQKNPFVEKYISKAREKLKINLLHKDDASVRNMMNMLKEDKTLMLIADQDAHGDGIMLDFLGVPASTYRGIASIAMRSKKYPLPVFLIRLEPGVFKFYVGDHVLPNQQLHLEDRQKDLLSKTNNILSEKISQYPYQWLWGHRRWRSYEKTQNIKP